jgi:hypothetical protein
MNIRGRLVFRAYLSLEKPQLQVNFRVLLGFMAVFWNRPMGRFGMGSIYCAYAFGKHN